MSKQTKHFEYYLDVGQEILITGIGEYYPGCQAVESIDYDIEEIWFQSVNILPVINLLHGSAKEVQAIHEKCIETLQEAFKPNAERIPARRPEPFPELHPLFKSILDPFFNQRTAQI